MTIDASDLAILRFVELNGPSELVEITERLHLEGDHHLQVLTLEGEGYLRRPFVLTAKGKALVGAVAEAIGVEATNSEQQGRSVLAPPTEHIAPWRATEHEHPNLPDVDRRLQDIEQRAARMEARIASLEQDHARLDEKLARRLTWPDHPAR